jgi:pilus assembly protein Flp/PilA
MFDRKRREFISLLGGAAVAWPLAAQEAGRIYRLGFLIPSRRDTPALLAFFDELRLKDERAATAIEYGLIATGIAVAVIPVITGVGTRLKTTFTSIQTALR